MNKHRIAEAEEAVFFLNGMLVCIQNVFPAGKGSNQHTGETTPAADVPETASPSGEVPPVGPGMPESGSTVGPGGADSGPSGVPDMSGGDEEGVGPGFSDVL